MCKAITKTGIDISANDIEDCYLVRNKGQTIIKFVKKKISRQALSVRKDLHKIKMKEIDLTGQNTLYTNQPLPQLQDVMVQN